MSTEAFEVRAPIDLIVVGGYLGAGKTTVVNALLTEPHGKRIAVLVNDFGAVNIDAKLVRTRTDDVIELDNGCICCTIGGALVDALTRLEMRDDRPDVLVIEASGVSDPAKIAQIGLLNRAFRLTAVLTVADAVNFAQTLGDPRVGSMARQQLDGASAVIVTKLDLVPHAARAGVLARVRAQAATDIVVAADHGAIPPALAFDAAHADSRPAAASMFVGSRDGRWHPRIAMPAFESLALPAPGPLDKGRLKAWLKQLPRTILRAKGIVRLARPGDADGPAHVVQVAARRLQITLADHRMTQCATPLAAAPKDVLVFIGWLDADTIVALRQGLASCGTLAPAMVA
ncbi:cobalamin biosynthesis protein CobW [Pandoraea terrae]|uniref:Cobalamin biosynthesis protein CobW n=1 Tax=Pandoraea terrae TaxID=1537710 RepID=A0A5E4W8L9_9BURK|nr:GTP-binding protein [Pandoraea terrae]VVE21337.1 cobalamin biosynthesis protein CobW [Pandoraea terrae]